MTSFNPRSGRRVYGKGKVSRRAARRDGNELEIVVALEAIGADVVKLDNPDLLVGFRGVNWLLEVKNPAGLNRVSDDQEQFMVDWRGGRVAVVRTADEALMAVGAIRKDGRV